MFTKIQEGKAIINVPKETKISKELPVFYNPVMKYNRDISIALLKALKRENMHIADPLAGTGVRTTRMLCELPKKAIKLISINDYDADALKIIKKNLKESNADTTKIEISNLDANVFFTNSQAFDYIDIDPFGTPNPFLNNAIAHLKRDGILAVTATDTAGLCGTFPKVCMRKYWANPLHNHEMHEAGLRILIRKVQLLGTQFDRALTPLLSYSKDHYFRIFFVSQKGKKACDEILKQHGMYKEAGPMWLGQLKDQNCTKKINFEAVNNQKEKNTITFKLNNNFTNTLQEELDIVGFYNIPALLKKYKIPHSQNFETILSKIHKTNKATRTHFDDQGIKTAMNEEMLVKILKEKL